MWGAFLIYAINVHEEEYQRALLVPDASIISQISKTVSFQVTSLEINHWKKGILHTAEGMYVCL